MAVQLLKVTLDGVVVAEAALEVHDQEGAWKAFTYCFPGFAHLIAGELFNTMHVACNDELRAATPDTGLVIDLNTTRREL